MSRLKTKRRCQSINSPRLEVERPLSFSLSTISVDTTRGMTSKKIDAAATETRKSEVTAHTRWKVRQR